METELGKIEAYFSALPAEARDKLTEMRAIMRDAAPQAEEGMSYGMPAFKQNGPLVAYGAFKTHCSLFPMGPGAIEEFQDELAGYQTSKGTIQFPLDTPLPSDLISRIVKWRSAVNEEKARAKKQAKERG